MQIDSNVEVPIIRPIWLHITEQPVIKILFSEPLGLVIAALADGQIQTVNLQNGESIKKWTAHGMGNLNACLSPDKLKLATTGEDNKIKIFDLKTNEMIFEWKSTGWLDHLIWINDTLFFTGSKKIFCWNSSSQGVLEIDKWDFSISALALKDPNCLAVAGYSRLSFYSLTEFKESRRFDWKGQLDSLHFSPKQRYAVCASNDMTIHIWDLKKDKDLSMRGFPAKIRDITFRPDGLYMANSSGPEVAIWDYMDPGPANKRPVILGPFDKDINFVRYQNRSKMLASFGEDGVILFWRPDLFDDRPLAIAGIRDQPITAAAWTDDDHYVITGLRTGYLALYPVPVVREDL